MKEGHPSYEVTYREIHSRDYQALGEIIVDTWRFGDISSDPRTVAHFGCSYLLTSLLHQTYHQAAFVDGKPAGIIISADQKKKRMHMKYLLQMLLHGFPMLLDKDLKERNRHWEGYHEKTEELLSQAGVPFDAELTLFIVDRRYRGLGIGRHLYEGLMEFYRKQQVKTFYLQTDTGCDYEFYEHQGLKLLAQCKTGYSYAGVTDITMFLYGGEVK
ncbi:MAG: GNAT family N-acetyltransferase [Blautia sp.]|jgi:GNAT superfamily N-acetyltransferase